MPIAGVSPEVIGGIMLGTSGGFLAIVFGVAMRGHWQPETECN